MTTEADTIESDTPPRWVALSWMLIAGVSAVSFVIYTISLPFMAPEGLPHLAIAVIAVLGLAPLFSNLFFCPWMNIGFGVAILTPILGVLTFAYPNWFMIGITMLIAGLASMMWALSSLGAASEFREHNSD